MKHLRTLSVVDRAMEVVDEYQNKILKLEHDILIKPSMKSVRYREFSYLLFSESSF